MGFCFVVCVIGLSKPNTTGYFFHCGPEYGIFRIIYWQMQPLYAIELQAQDAVKGMCCVKDGDDDIKSYGH